VTEAMKIGQQQVLPAVRQMPGFRGMLALVDEASGNGMAITLWDSESAMKASEVAAERLRATTVSDSGSQVAAVERYQVAYSVMADTV
jgi:hypothetical protein